MVKSKKEYYFPKKFLWGSATASYQVEGNIDNNDWAEAARKGKVPSADPGIGQYRKYSQDFDLLEELSQDGYRMSLEWSRIEPRPGYFDLDEIDHYKKVLEDLKRRNIKTFVTLWHFTLPIWFARKGGFTNSEAHNTFRRYAQFVVKKLGHLIDHIDTMNEPLVYVSNGYVRGNWPPFYKKRLVRANLVEKELIKTHICTYCALKRQGYDGEIGVVKNQIYFHSDKNPLNVLKKKIAEYQWNDRFMHAVRHYIDSIGLNYYFHHYFGPDKKRHKKTDFGWDIYPEGIYHAISDLKKYNVPIYITENGLADAKDKNREKFIKDHLYQVWRAIQGGADVRGYFHWSLLDNFEWAEGYSKKFGLIEVDLETKERKIRKSALAYKQICESNKLVR